MTSRTHSLLSFNLLLARHPPPCSQQNSKSSSALTVEAPGVCGSQQALQEKGDHNIREVIPRTSLWWSYHGRWHLIEMNDHLTASSHPQRLSEKPLHLYLNPPTSYPRTFISHKTLCINTMEDLNGISHYFQVWIHSKKSAPARMEDALFLQDTKNCRQTLTDYLPGPGGYGCVPVIKYSSSCPKEQ